MGRGAPPPISSMSARVPFGCPRMLVMSYAALVRLDAVDPGVIEDGSTADLVSGRLIRLGTWTTWRRGARARRTPTPARRSDRFVLPPELTADYEHPASQRVASYLGGVAEARGVASLQQLLS